MGRTSGLTAAERRAMLRDRTEAIAAMNADCRRKFNMIDKRHADRRETNLRYYHQLGKDLLEIKSNPDKYDRAGYRLICTAMQTHSREAGRAVLFAEMYTDEQLEELCGLRNDEANFTIHWGHMSYLLGLNTATKRAQFAAEAVEKLLTPPQLHARIKRERGSRGGGRTHALPQRVSGQIHQMKETTRIWVEKNNNVWNGDDISALANIMNTPPEEFTLSDVDDLREIDRLLGEMLAGATRTKADLARVITHVDNILSTVPVATSAPGQTPTPTPVGRRNRRVVQLGSPAVG